MGRVAIISVDGHVRASRQTCRDSVECRYLDDYDDGARSVDGSPDSGDLARAQVARSSTPRVPARRLSHDLRLERGRGAWVRSREP
jgi:hypothetical protein